MIGWILALGIGMLFLYLPSFGGRVFLSPDETANAVGAMRFAETGSLRMSQNDLSEFPWMHPRSFVTQGDALVPVGFVGTSILASVFYRIGGSWGMTFFFALLALSVAYPIWKCMLPLGKWPARAGVIAWLTFPTVLLYANRGLFPNLPVVSLTVWSLYLLQVQTTETKKRTLNVLAGVLIGLALSIRPVEVIWILPWNAFAMWWAQKKEERSLRKMVTSRETALFFASVLFTSCVFAIVGRTTYGSWLAIGYHLKDVGNTSDQVVAVASGQASQSLTSVLPFGIHPRNIWFNVKSYLISFMWPWFLLGIAGVAVFWKDRSKRIWIVLAGWTMFSLFILYGSGLYQDHVRLGAVTVGNSFLRYMLPLSVVGVFLVAGLVRCIETWITREGVARVVIVFFLACVSFFGIWTAFLRDDEGLIQDRIELQRYSDIRAQAVTALPADTVVFSDRSDKIFYPVFRVAPVAGFENLLAYLLEQRGPVAFFGRTFDEKSINEWADRGVRFVNVLEAGNETLYIAEQL